MHYYVDVEHEYQIVKSKFFRLSLLFSAILAGVILADVLLILLTKGEYRISMIIAIIVTILFSWFAIYFFTNIYSDVNARYRYFKGYESGLKSTDEVVFINQSSDLSYINGLYVYEVRVRFISTLTSEEKIIYTLKDKLSFQEGDKLSITTYQRILINAEKHKWMR